MVELLEILMLQNVAGLKSLFVQWVTGNSVCQFMINLTRAKISHSLP